MKLHTRSSHAVLLAVFALIGCSGIGPSTVQRDRFDYQGAVTRSWKEQTLLNIVKVRYLDMPAFLDVSQIVASYTLEGTLTLGAAQQLSSAASAVGDTSNVAVTGRWADTPTITYTPLIGSAFSKRLLTPLPPSMLLFMTQAGWPVDMLMLLTVQSINGIEAAGPTAERYQRLVALLRGLQLKEALGTRVLESKSGDDTIDKNVLFFKADKTLDAEARAMKKEVIEILGLPEDRNEYQVIYGLEPTAAGELAIITRSMMQIMMLTSRDVEIPQSDERDGRALQVPPTGAERRRGALHIKYSNTKGRPNEAYAAVPYRSGWFWIDDRDVESKRTFAAVMILFTVAETGGRENLPLVTIPSR